jgi:hypothetical protein
MIMMFMNMHGYSSNSEFVFIPSSIPIPTNSLLQNCADTNTGMVSRKGRHEESDYKPEHDG